MADKHFKVKNNVQVSELTTAGPVTVDANGVLASHTTLAIDKGGTGQTTAANAINALLPSQTNNTNKVLASNGTNVSWVNNGAAYQTSAPSSPNVGDLWVDSDETGDSLDPYIIRRKTITATAGQTVFTTDVTFTDGYEQVYYNGVLLVRTTDYTTSGGTNTVTLLQGASAGDTIEIIASTPINAINTPILTGPNTFTGNQTFNDSSGITRFTINHPGELMVGQGMSTNGAAIEVGLGRTGNGPSYVDLIGDTTYTDYGFRVLRGAAGANAPSSILHRGVGDLNITTQEAAAILLKTSNTERMRIDSNGQVGIGPIVTGTFNKGLSINSEAGQYAGILLVNNSTGTTNSDGTAMYISNSNFVINNREASDISILTNNIQRIGISSNGTMALNAPSGATSPTDYAWLGLNGGPVSIRDILANGGEASDWPVPSLSIYSFDNYNENTMLSFLYRDDTNYMTDFSKWNFRLSDSAGSITSSTSSTNLKFGGPGSLIFLTGNAERMRLRSDGHLWLGSVGDANWHLAVSDSTANAGAFLSTTSTQALAGLFEVTNGSYGNVVLKLQANRAATSAYSFIQALSGGTADAEFNIRGDGQAYADGSWNAGGADYAEYFEWEDGNINNEDRRGYSVCLIQDKIKIAEENDTVIGVISGNPSVVGDSAWNKWNGKYLVDRFGSYIMEDYEVEDEKGNTVIQKRRKINPEYNDEQEYVSRENRPEWGIVGLMGKLRLRKGQVTGAGWIKMKDIDEDTEEWLVK